MDGIIRDLQRSKVLGFEMESSLLFLLAVLFGLKAGSVLAVFANRATGVPPSGEGDCARVACEAVKILYEKGLLLKKT